MCDHRLWNAPDGLQCVRNDEHPDNPRGHVYRSDAGSEVNDRHTERNEDW